MDFKELLLEAERNHKEFVKQSKQIKRVNTNFTTPAPREKASRPRSEAIQKLLDEKQAEERQKKEAEERRQRQKEKAREEREREEQRKNTFRIPKKTAADNPPSDAESFSSISSGDEAKLASSSSTKHSSHHGAHQSSAAHADGDKSHKSSSREHSEKKERDSHRSSSHSHSEKKDRHSHKSSSHHHSEKTDRHSHKSSSHEHAGKTEKHSHKSSEHSSSSSHSSDKHKSSDHSSRSHSHHRSKSNDSKHHSERHKHSSEKRDSGSSKTHHGSSGKDKSHSSSGHSKTSGQDSPKYRHIELKNKKIVIEDKALIVAENDSSGYITSPDISSEEEDNTPAPAVSKPHVGHAKKGNPSNSVGTKQRSDSTESKEEGENAPVTLIRHHLKPTKERVGGSASEREKMLEKLKSIQKRNEEDDPGPARKRSAWGEVKKRRAKREKLDGDFTGSCMQKIDYDEEEKPSLKRPEPKPEEPKEIPVKRKRPKLEKLKDSKALVNERPSVAKGSGKLNRFDEMQEKPKIRPKPAPRPPPLGFAELMKLAEKKQTEAVMVDVAPKKEKERRPLTQEELDRKQAREERMKSKEYKDWYLHGNSTLAKKKEAEKPESQSGGFLRPSHDVVPPKSGSKPFAIPRKGDNPSSARVDKQPPSTVTNHSPEGQRSASHSVPVPKSKPHPTRPGMIANKPQAMAQHMNSERRSEAARPSVKEREKVPSSQPQPKPSGSAVVDRTREGNAWDRLFSRPEYSKMKEPPVSKKRKQVIDSEEEDDYEDDYDEDMDDFIDDEGEEGAESVSSVIQQLFRYDRKRYRDEDDDDRNMEASFKDVMKEEARSARIGRQEDLEDIRKEEEEKRMKKMRKMKGK